MKNTQGKTTIWVRVPNLPIHCYNEEFLWNLGNIIGKSLKVDLKTLAYEQSDKSIIERGRFERSPCFQTVRMAFDRKEKEAPPGNILLLTDLFRG